jgi:hypothetical protein
VRTTTLLAAFVLLVLAAAAGGQTSSPDKADNKPTGPTVEQLVEQLGDPDFRKRDLAAEMLKSEGLKAVPAMKAALKHPDPEVRRRLVDLIPTIETAALLAPKRVTLKAKDKTLNEIFAELSKQTGYRYEFQHNNPNGKFTVDLDNATFWEAVDQVGKQTGMVLQQGYGDDHVRFYWAGGGNGGGSPYTCTDGGFRFAATGFQMYRHVDLTQPGRGGNRSESLTLMFTIQSEPKLPLLGLGEPRLSAAFDNEKHSMLQPSNPNEGIEFEGRHGRFVSRYGNGNRMWFTQSQVYLVRASEKATKLAVVRGVVPVTLLAEQKPHVVAEKILEAKGKKATVGTTTLHVEEVTAVPNTNQISVRLTINEDTGGNPNDYSWQNSIYQRIEVQDAKGNKFQLYGTNWGNSGPNSLQMTLTYAPMNPNQKPEGDVKLIFQEWKVIQHQLKFEFKDLPLP